MRGTSLVLAGTLLAAPLTTTLTPAAQASGQAARAGWVTASGFAHVRSCAKKKCLVVDQVRAAGRYLAVSCARGEQVKDQGRKNRYWVRISQGDRKHTGWLSAVYLKGVKNNKAPAGIGCK